MQSVYCSYTVSLAHTHHPGVVWQAQPSLALAGFAGTVWSNVFLFYLFCRLQNVIPLDCDTSAPTFITKVHIKDGTAPRAFCISVRNLSRTVITRCSVTPKALTQTPPGKRGLWWHKYSKCFCLCLRMRGTHQRSQQQEQEAHTRLWQWRIKVRKELSLPHFHLYSKAPLGNWAKSAKLKSQNIPGARRQLSAKQASNISRAHLSERTCTWRICGALILFHLIVHAEINLSAFSRTRTNCLSVNAFGPAGHLSLPRQRSTFIPKQFQRQLMSNIYPVWPDLWSFQSLCGEKCPVVIPYINGWVQPLDK